MSLKIAAIGDSVVWGQGLATDDKFTRITAREVPEIDATDVIDLSHSGAKIGPDNLNDPFHGRLGQSAFPDIIKGEIPSSTPSIIAQIDALAALNRPVDVIIMDGFANDVGFFAPAVPDADAFSVFLKEVLDTAPQRISFALAHLRRRFPDALVIYSGYYPGMSEDSNLPAQADVLQANLLIFATTLGNVILPGLGFLIGTLGAIASENAKKQIKRQYRQFADEIQAAVTLEIARHNEVTAQSEVIYSQSGFSTRNAMYGPDPFIHALFQPFNETIGRERADFAFDHVPPTSTIYETRAEARAQVGKALPVELSDLSEELGGVYAMLNAHLAHPNKAGARRYADVMVPRTGQQTAFSLRDRMQAVGVGEGLVKAGLNNRLGLDLGNRSLRAFGSLSRIDCFECELLADPFQVFTNAPPFTMEINWGQGWHNMRSLRRRGTWWRGYWDFPDAPEARQMTSVRVAVPRKAVTHRRFSGRFFLRMNGNTIFNTVARHGVSNRPDTFRFDGDRAIIDVPTVSAPA